MTRSKKKDPVVKATTLFVDARTGNTYQKGDVVEGWEEERAAHYASIGLVVIEQSEDEPEKDDGQMTIDDVPNEKDEKEEAAKKPGPSETKPKQGPSKKK